MKTSTQSREDAKAQRWEKNMIYRIRRTVRCKRVMRIDPGKLLRYRFVAMPLEDVVSWFAEKASVDFIYRQATNEVSFFEFN